MRQNRNLMEEVQIADRGVSVFGKDYRMQDIFEYDGFSVGSG